MKKTLCLLLMFGSLQVFSQKTISVDYQKKALKEVLADIEEKTDLLFSYSEEIIKNKTITLVNTAISEAQLLAELTSQTRLNFEKVSNTQIIITKRSGKIAVCGYLFDAETGEVLPFATLFVKGTSIGATSDDNGFFQIKDIEQEAVILIQYVGYSNKTIDAFRLKNENCRNIYLQPKVQSLREILVFGYLTKGVYKNKDGSLTLKNDELGILPGLVEPDVFQSLQLVPGISSLDESASGIQIRGGSPDQNLIYFDGIKMYHIGHFFGMISAINPYVAKSAKIYKGGASPEYGGRISGVIDISSDKEIPAYTSGGGGINGTHADAFIKTPLGKKTGLILSARRSYTDVLQTPTFDALSEKVFQNTKVVRNNEGQVVDEDDPVENIGQEDFFFYDGSAKVMIEPSEDDKIAISGFFSNNDLDFSVRDDENLTTDKLVVKKQGASLSWQGKKFDKWRHSFKTYYSNLDTNYNNNITEQIEEEIEVEEENLRKNTVKDFGLDVNLTYDISDIHTVKAGYQYSNANVFFQLFRDEADENDIDPNDDEDIVLPAENRDFNIKQTAVNRSHSVYTEYTYRPENKGLIAIGLRASHYSLANAFFVEPRVNAEYPVSNILRLKATVEKRYQPISQLIEFEDIQLRLEDQIWTLSDGSDTPVLESTQFSGGVLLDVNGWTLDIDGYLKKIKGLTSFTNGFTNAAEEFSEGSSDITGLDVLVRKKIGDYRIWLGYTFNDITYMFPELQDTPFRGNNDITHNFRISSTYELKKWELSLGWMYRTGSPFTPVDSFDNTTGDIDFGAINSERLPDYHRLDASVLYKFKASKKSNFRGTIGASLQNIYARQIPLSVSYRVDTNPDTEQEELDQTQQLSLGFTPNITLRLFF